MDANVVLVVLLLGCVGALHASQDVRDFLSAQELEYMHKSNHSAESAAPYRPRSFLMNQDSIRETFNKIYQYYLPIPESLSPNHGLRPAANLTKECARDVAAVYAAFQTSRPGLRPDQNLRVWAVQMMDAWGKAEDGVLSGNGRWLGFFDQCLASTGVSQDVPDDLTTDVSTDVDVTTDVSRNVVVNVTFRGQYCIVTALPSKTSLLKGLLPVQYATCMPSSCTEQELEVSDLHPFVLHRAGVGASSLDTIRAALLCLKHQPAAVLLLMVLPVVAATVAHLATGRLPAYVKAFSLKENLKKLAATANIYARRDITALHGIRVMSIAWVILGHHYTLASNVTQNILTIPRMTEPWTFQMVWAANYAVDTFFTLSGLLTTMAIMKTNFCLRPSASLLEAKPNSEHGGRDAGGSNIVRAIRRQGAASTALVFGKTYVVYVAHRLLRMTPTLLLVIMYCAGPSLYFIDGPFRRGYHDLYLKNCRQNWWVDLTFASNYLYKHPSCIGSSWYIGTDFQLHLIAPFILLPMKLVECKLLYAVVVVVVFSLLKGTLVVANDLILAPLMGTTTPEIQAYDTHVYYPPYTRAAPFFVGSLIAVLMMQFDAANKAGTLEQLRWLQLLKRKVMRATGWLVFAVTVAAVVFGLSGKNYSHLFGTLPPFGGAESFFYASFATPAWAMCVGWLVLTSYCGCGGGVGTLLAQYVWVHEPCCPVTAPELRRHHGADLPGRDPGQLGGRVAILCFVETDAPSTTVVLLEVLMLLEVLVLLESDHAPNP
ncbi:nose resistant to fluoxetine protein 6 [Hyalella azteca]|uniref:Nose resistant to fluoxetine protein 6 n=1 Tax=Hyalella azteca TaxID=294128 RepID=A0A8B7PA38_HYAAZ|nr:nose resistant to fluoxetine protein 6 [Hyalella azteca]